MATSLISNIQKEQIKAIIDDIHETFARNITVFEEGEKVLISASSEYNAIYGRARTGSTTQKVSVSHTIKARIKYINSEETILADGAMNSQSDIELIDGSVRITVDADGFAILKEAKRAEFEGRRYKIVSKGNPTGIFGPQYYHFFLQPLDE
jgi:head-tail adaptor